MIDAKLIHQYHIAKDMIVDQHKLNLSNDKSNFYVKKGKDVVFTTDSVDILLGFAFGLGVKPTP